MVGDKPGRYGFYLPRDKQRDQSYFLFATTQEQLNFLRFPLGGLTKPETRDLAHDFGLNVAEKPDSQDICFVPNGRYAELILKLRPEAERTGEIVHVNGDVLGEHRGIVHYTIGQRRGLGIAAGDPLYVIKLDVEGNRVIVGPREALTTQEVILRDVNWLGDTPLCALTETSPMQVMVRVRSTRPPKPAFLFKRDGHVCVQLTEGEAGVSPGQACVFYDENEDNTRMLGGGWIEEAKKSAQVERLMTNLLSLPAA